jgi:hypothetical protein
VKDEDEPAKYVQTGIDEFGVLDQETNAFR